MDELWADKTPSNTIVVAVEWADIRNVSRWDDGNEEVRPARKLSTTGWLLHDGIDPDDPEEEIVIIAATYDGEEKTWADITTFPKRAFRGYT